MKKLFIYYSYTGNGALVAERLASKGYDLRAVKRKKRMPHSFVFGILTGGFLAGIRHKDALDGFDASVEEYDEIVIGSPVWNGRISSPINTVLSEIRTENKKLTFLFYAGSGEAPKAVGRIRKEYPSARCVLLKEPKKHPEELVKVDEL